MNESAGRASGGMPGACLEPKIPSAKWRRAASAITVKVGERTVLVIVRCL